MDTDTRISVIAGRPGAGKTRWAARAGVHVNVLCQIFSQIDRGDINWLNEYCTPFVISKSREPRLATQEEIQEKYR